MVIGLRWSSGLSPLRLHTELSRLTRRHNSQLIPLHISTPPSRSSHISPYRGTAALRCCITALRCRWGLARLSLSCQWAVSSVSERMRRAGAAIAAVSSASTPARHGAFLQLSDAAHGSLRVALPRCLRCSRSRGFASSSASAAILRSAAEPLAGAEGGQPAQVQRDTIPAGTESLPSSPSSSLRSSFASNVTSDVLAKVGRRLHLQAGHPLSLIRERVVDYFQRTFPSPSSSFAVYDSLHPQVSVQQNFDDLLVPPQHPSRRLTDTFYLDENTCLRTHTSAHQTQFLRAGVRRFLVFGDCYRRDEIDASHYPVFHQVEGVCVWPRTGGVAVGGADLRVEGLVADLQRVLNGLVDHLFGPHTPRRWLDDSFPFTSPSLQVEVQFQGKWMEVLGCGIIQSDICRQYRGKEGEGEVEVVGWAFGLGLERLAMILFDIPDIRLFWSSDQRFLDQFRRGTGGAGGKSTATPSFHSIKFSPFSKYPPCPKDLSFWLPDLGKGKEGQDKGVEAFHENDLYAVIRSVAGDWVETVRLVGDEFAHPTTHRRSRCYRIVYRSMSHSLTNDEVNAVHQRVREALQHTMQLQLR